MNTTNEDTMIIQLRDEAAVAGDMEQVRICDEALSGSRAARAECARVAAEARAQR